MALTDQDTIKLNVLLGELKQILNDDASIEDPTPIENKMWEIMYPQLQRNTQFLCMKESEQDQENIFHETCVWMINRLRDRDKVNKIEKLTPGLTYFNLLIRGKYKDWQKIENRQPVPLTDLPSDSAQVGGPSVMLDEEINPQILEHWRRQELEVYQHLKEECERRHSPILWEIYDLLIGGHPTEDIPRELGITQAFFVAKLRELREILKIFLN